jgi:hypothetical protein
MTALCIVVKSHDKNAAKKILLVLVLLLVLDVRKNVRTRTRTRTRRIFIGGKTDISFGFGRAD